MTRLRHTQGDTLSSIIAVAIRAKHHVGLAGAVATLEHFAEAHIEADPKTHLLLEHIAGVFRVAEVGA